MKKDLAKSTHTAMNGNLARSYILIVLCASFLHPFTYSVSNLTVLSTIGPKFVKSFFAYN
jgi:hypothetical protein